MGGCDVVSRLLVGTELPPSLPPNYPQKKAGTYRRYVSDYLPTLYVPNWATGDMTGRGLQYLGAPHRELMARGMPYSGPEIIVRTSNRDIDFTYIIHTYLVSIIRGNRYTVPNYHLVVT